MTPINGKYSRFPWPLPTPGPELTDIPLAKIAPIVASWLTAASHTDNIDHLET
ncbi:MAG: hypothetical protein AB2693_24220 [Candidatus Thiodiazotropha sp.]|nr:hypothetical protein [Candidatus Thiodiazotropha taylori]MCG8044197.1 hypothetical protein [Candidatus Thiodiazotropha taylori]MCW4341879.1 hypothetical protein [Candidatus Thiodiazotropha endolucinida]